jgi:DNA repair protein RecN (Recombination protein N)
MIAELSVSQFAIIDQTTLPLGRGFTVLTGETGAGKSLLIDAIQLALGERADTDLVRDQAKSAIVSIAFDLSDSPGVQALCVELGAPLEDGMLFVTREVFAEGRSQCRLGGRLAPAQVLRQIGETLVDLHGQHDHQSLLHQERHLDYLDLWIGPTAKVLRGQTREIFATMTETRRRLSAIRSEARDRERKIDQLRYQIEEIEGVSPAIGEYEQTQNTLRRLLNLERLTSAASLAKDCLSDTEGSVLELGATALKALEEGGRFDPVLSALADQLREILFQAEDLASSLAQFKDGLESSSGESDQISDRLEALKKLRRKYGSNETAVLETLANARAELLQIEAGEEGEEELERRLAVDEAEFGSRALELSELRKQKSRQFSEDVETQLKDLAFETARFGVGIKPASGSTTGIDDVEFVFSANPGEPLRPLHRVASGGEVSRLMLALKTVLAGKAGVPTLIFDEIDIGLGGRVGSIVGRKLAELSSVYQVIVISHLPQVAALASSHFRIEKSEVDGRTATRVRRLDPEERLTEIARMLAGETLTETALAHARDMLGS